MRLSDFHYDLPPELIATHPAARRDEARLMVVRRDGSPFEHRRFTDLPDLLRPGDCLVVNDSRVLPARLRLRRPSGGLCELLLLAPLAGGVWEAMARPARRLKPGTAFDLPGGAGRVEVVVGGGERTRHVRFELAGGLSVVDFLERHGETPLPPYILHQRQARGETPAAGADDRDRYQTVYARTPGSVAAPTAGLHFTPELLERLAGRGIEIRRVTLHVGAGTFEPVMADRIEDHVMHHEWLTLGETEARAIEAARLDPARRIVAVGTTSVRTLEACFAAHGAIRATTETTGIFIYPGKSFAVVDAMVTNFHLPGSTLLMLVAAFAGRERILAAYAEAMARRYRFYSYGDAMLLE
ncbi:MAG: tRNA preQ1(34) S-adenosylmethionine ribosyltransferase-isomerase QueA [bacterium]|nr:tRNA preQ1(34) S-adenosylmethionine ribosyltransferase-isomerase QueA [bacterium]